MSATAEDLSQTQPGGQSEPQDTPTPAPTDWRAELPDDLRTNESLASIKDVAGLAKGYVHAQGMLGNAIRIPTDHASDEDKAAFIEKLKSVPGVTQVPTSPDDAEGWDRFYAQMGRPETAEGYGEYKPEDWPERYEYSSELEGHMKDVFHKVGLTKAQSDGIMHAFTSKQVEMMTDLQNSENTSAEELKKEWGAGYERNLNQTKAAIQQFCDDDEHRQGLLEELDRTGLGNLPYLARAWRNVGVQMLETDALERAGKDAGIGESAHELQSKINEVLHNRKHAYYDSSNPGHRAAVDMVMNWHEQLDAMRRSGSQ